MSDEIRDPWTEWTSVIDEDEDFVSEGAKYRHLVEKYCGGCGVDIGSQGDSIVPWAMGLDLPIDEFNTYSGGQPQKGPIQLRGHADNLPFDDASLSFVASSHFIEDVEDWEPLLRHWVSKLQHGGKLIILLPDKELFAAAVARGQPGNPAHKHEGRVGELSEYAERLGLRVLEDRLTNCFEGDYTIFFCAERL